MEKKSISVFLVEDNPGDAHRIREMLASTTRADPHAPRFDVVRATKFSTGLKRLAKGRFNALLLDLSLPDSQGLDTLVKTHAQVPEVPIIILSDVEDRELALKAVQMGAQDYLVKGEVSGSLLVRAIQYAIERRQAEEALRKRIGQELGESEEKFRTLAEQSPNMIFINRRGRVLYANKRCEEIMGYTREEFYSADFDFVAITAPEYVDLVKARFAQRMRGKDVEPYEYALITKGGERIEAIITPRLIDYEGESAILGIITDITERKHAEEALRRREHDFSTLVENAADMIVRFDADLRHVYCNPAVERQLGVPVQTFLGKAPLELDGPREQGEFIDRSLRQALETGEELEVEQGYPTPFGLKHFQTRIMPERDASGCIESLLAITRDVTKHRRAEEALGESEQRYRFITEKMTDAVWLMDMEFKPTFISPSVTRSLGYTLEELQALSLDKLLTPASFEFAMETVATEMSPERLAPRLYERSATVELEFHRKDGSTLWSESTITLLRDSEGRPTGLIGVGRDITERKRSEEALRESEKRYRRLFDDAVLGVFQSTPEGGVITVNPAFARMFGYESPADVIASVKNVATDLLAEPERRSEIMRLMAEKPDLRTFENLYRRKDGSTFTGNLHVWSVKDADGRLRHLEGFVEDITDRKQAEEALQESEERFRQVLESLQDVAYRRNLQTDTYDYMSPAQLHVSGYTAEEMLSMPTAWVVDRIHPDDLDHVMRALEEPMAGEQRSFHLEYRFKCKDGQYRWMSDLFTVVRDTQGCPLYRVGTVRDITERKRAEEALQQSQQMLQTVLDTIPVRVFWKDRNSVFMGCNKAHLGDYGFNSPEEVIGMDDFDLNPVWAERYRADDQQVMQSGVPKLSYEEPKTQLDGTQRWRRTSKAPLQDLDGSIIGVLGISEDITERKQAEEALRKAELEKETILDSQLEHVIYQDREHKILWPNQAACESAHMTREELIGRHCYEIWPQRSERCEDCPVALAMETGKQQEIEKTTPDGKAWFVRGYPVRDTSGQIVGAIEVTLDITERKQAEEERERLLVQIREQAQRVQQIVDTVPEGVILIDTEYRTVLANPMGQRDLNTLASAQVGDVLTHLGGCPLAEILTSPPKGLWHEVTLSNRSFQIIARPIEDGPSPKGWVLVIRDVTQQREAERRIQQQERLVAVGQLAAGIAHDFNNVMAVISLYTGMVLRTPGLPKKTYARLETVKQQAGRASTLIQQVLDFSRRAVLERGPTDMLVFLKEQSELLRRILPEDIKIDLTYGKDKYMVRADPTRIQQAIVNLATNARDAMPEGGQLRIGLDRIHVQDRSSAPLPEMEIGNWVRVTVADTGTGIPPDVMEHIFDPFFTTKPPGQGTGLGLAQVYGTIKQHDGYIDVSTTVGEGTTFALYLPALSMEQSTTPPEPRTLTGGQGQTILVIEDEAATRKAIVDSLGLLGYQVLEAANGQKALTVFEQHEGQIDLVLSDVVMPEMGGKALFLALKQRYPGVKVVLMSGHPLGATEIETLLADGLSDWLPKPPTLEQLARVMAQALAEDARQSEPPGNETPESG